MTPKIKTTSLKMKINPKWRGFTNKEKWQPKNWIQPQNEDDPKNKDNHKNEGNMRSKDYLKS